MGIIWTIIIGFVAGVIAKLITPGSNEPSGFILTTILGIGGAFVATWLGQALGWYSARRRCRPHWRSRGGHYRVADLGRICGTSGFTGLIVSINFDGGYAGREVHQTINFDDGYASKKKSSDGGTLRFPAHISWRTTVNSWKRTFRTTFAMSALGQEETSSNKSSAARLRLACPGSKRNQPRIAFWPKNNIRRQKTPEASWVVVQPSHVFLNCVRGSH